MRVALRWLGRGLLVLLLAIVGLWCCGYGKQWLLRWRAQRLLADVKAMEVRHATWTDAQRFMTRWGRWGNYSGRCDAHSCQYLVMITNSFPMAWYPDDESPFRARLRRVLENAGLRPSSVLAGFEIRNDLLVDHNFGMSTEFRTGGDLYIVSGEGPHVPEETDRKLHLDYSVGPHPSSVFLAMFTPDADKAKKEQMFHFRFDCLTALRACDGVQDVLPEPDAEAKSDRVTLEREEGSSCGLPFWVKARDEQTVVEGDVVRAKREKPLVEDSGAQSGQPDWTVVLHVTRVLKGKRPPLPGGMLPAEMDGSVRTGIDGKFPYKTLIVAGRPIPESDVSIMGPLESSTCAVVEATPDNIAEAEKGVRADFAPYLWEP